MGMGGFKPITGTIGRGLGEFPAWQQRGLLPVHPAKGDYGRGAAPGIFVLCTPAGGAGARADSGVSAAGGGQSFDAAAGLLR